MSEKPKRPEDHDPSKPISEQPDHSMNEEEKLGWDQAPTNPEDAHRHPRPKDPGGVPKD